MHWLGAGARQLDHAALHKGGAATALCCSSIVQPAQPPLLSQACAPVLLAAPTTRRLCPGQTGQLATGCLQVL